MRERYNLEFRFLFRAYRHHDRNTSPVPLEARPELFEKGLYTCAWQARADAGCERNREARKYGDSDGEILRWQTVAAVLKLSVRRGVPSIPSVPHEHPSPPPVFAVINLPRAKVGNTRILITAGHRGNSVGPTNHGARPINSRPYCGWERDGCETAAATASNGRCVHRHSGELFLPRYKSSHLNLGPRNVVLPPPVIYYFIFVAETMRWIPTRSQRGDTRTEDLSSGFKCYGTHFATLCTNEKFEYLYLNVGYHVAQRKFFWAEGTLDLTECCAWYLREISRSQYFYKRSREFGKVDIRVKKKHRRKRKDLRRRHLASLLCPT